MMRFLKPSIQRYSKLGHKFKYHVLFKFPYFYTFVSVKTLEIKTSIDLDNISEEILPSL